MTVQEIYERYRIMPALQLHQLRVAAVGKLIGDNALFDVDTQSVVLAGLFHDMANIIKSELTVFPEFTEPEGIGHWQRVKDEMIAKYGKDEHRAAAAIANEIGLPDQVRTLIDHIGFSKMEWIRDHASLEQKIAEYADLRISPHGVVSMRARLEESKLRYTHKHPDLPRSEETYERLFAAAVDIELQIFQQTAIGPDDVTEAAAAPLFADFRALPVA